MKKVIWISLGTSIFLVNLAAWLAEYYTGFYIEIVYRFILILGITFITAIFVGAYLLVNQFETERPLTGHTSDTLQSEADQGQSKDKPSTNKPAGKSNE
jgi:hypothetical protein